MKLGFNLLLWTPHVTLAHEPILRALKKTGYDGVEIPMFEGDPAHYARLGELLDKIGLERSVVSVIGPGQEPAVTGQDAPEGGAEYAKWTIDCTAALGARILGGPDAFRDRLFLRRPATAAERKRALSFHKRAGDYAAKKKVTFALEALNRFECYFLNTMEQLAAYVEEVNHPAIAAMYDTFHANIEEKDPVAAIRTIRPHLAHVHISENDRGTPGKGHVPWAETYKALKKAKYDGFLTIEAFGSAMPALAAATRVWRDFAPNPEEVYKFGFRNMSQGWAKA